MKKTVSANIMSLVNMAKPKRTLKESEEEKNKIEDDDEE